MRKVGFVGLGDQGGPMALALAETCELHLWARREQSYALFANSSYRRAKTAVALATEVDILCLCLPDDAAFRALVFDDGIADALRPGSIVVNHATGDPSAAAGFAQHLARKQIQCLDAPVSGGHDGAIKRTLTCFVGGEPSTLASCHDVLTAHSSHIHHLGQAGAGQMAKLLNNALTVSNLRNVVEVFSLAADAGVELRALQRALAFSSGGSFILQALGRQITPQIAEHIAHLNVKDVEEFGAAMSHIGMSADVLVNWALEGPKGLLSLVRLLEAASPEATTSSH